MKLRIGIYDDLLVYHFFKAEDQMIFFSVEQFRNFRIDSGRDLDAIQHSVFAEYFPENIMADGLAGHEIPFTFAVKTGLAQQPVQWLSYPLAGHLNQPHLRDGKDMGFAPVVF